MLHLLLSAVLAVTGAPVPTPEPSPYVQGGLAAGGSQPWNPNRAADFQLMRAAGAKFVRADLAWNVLAPESADEGYRFHVLDPMVKDARDAGLRFIGILHQLPGWANVNMGDYHPPYGTAMLEEYCYRVARHYMPKGVRDFEIGNEVNLDHPGWTISGAYYAEHMLIPCSKGIRKFSREKRIPVNILMGALAPTDAGGPADPVTFLRDMLNYNGASGSFHALSWHPYGTSPLTDAAMNETAAALHETASAKRPGGYPIWATEYGAPTCGAVSVDEAWQGRLVEEAFSTWSRHPFAGPLLWYSARDRGEPTSPEREDCFGVFRLDGTLKPAYHELRRVLTTR